MYIQRNIGESRYTVIMRRNTIERLRDTCFRGPSIARAGNFSAWPDVHVFIHDNRILDKIISEMRELALEDLSETHSFEIEFETPVGWSSTGKMDDYPREDLEEFTPNRRSNALRVKRDIGHLARRTNLVTIIFELKDEGHSMTAVVHSLYPGRDIGELFGDVSSREQIVFFDWAHPGE